MTDDDLEQEVPDLFAPESECRARQTARTIIGVRPHEHICREYPAHDRDHICHACGATWTKTQAAA